MTNDFEDFDARLDSFLKKGMSEREEQAFLSEIKANPDYIERATTVALATKTMMTLRREQGDKTAEAISNMDEKRFRAIVGKKHIPRRRKLALWYVAAACLIWTVCFGGYQYDRYVSTIKLGNEYEIIMPTSNIERGGGDMPRDLKVLFERVENGDDLKETSAKLEALYDVAIGEEYNDYTDYANAIGWNAAIAYLRHGKRSKAKAILETIIDRNPSTSRSSPRSAGIAGKARCLINLIDDI